MVVGEEEEKRNVMVGNLVPRDMWLRITETKLALKTAKNICSM